MRRLSFLGLLIWFIIFFLIGPLFPGFIETMVIQISFSAMLLMAVLTMTSSKVTMSVGAIIALVSIVANASVLYENTFWTEFWALITSIIFLAFTIVHLFRSVFLVKVVERDLIFGSLCTYILLAILWALIYQMIALISPGSFENVLGTYPHNKAIEKTMALKFHSYLYFSFVTQTTLGYGDVTPVTPIAKNFTAVQAIMGVFYLATIVGGLVSLLIKDRHRQ